MKKILLHCTINKYKVINMTKIKKIDDNLIYSFHCGTKSKISVGRPIQFPSKRTCCLMVLSKLDNLIWKGCMRSKMSRESMYQELCRRYENSIE